jgi:prepilin-type processing-associated H-X9-DG protein
MDWPSVLICIFFILLIHGPFLILFLVLLYKTIKSNTLNKWPLIIQWLLWIICTTVCLTVFWKGVPDARESARSASCINYLMQYGLAFHNYLDQNGHFPPAYIVNDHDQPAHSWRVLVLPYQEEEPAYKLYRFDESWNGPHNRTLSERTSDKYNDVMYLCPSDFHAGKNDTSIVMPVGPDAFSDGKNARQSSDIIDGTAHTIMLGEMSQSGIHWMEPRDLKTDEMSYKINDRNRPGFRSMHPGRVNMSFCDGAVRVIMDDVDPEVLKAAITISGGEPPADFDR